MKKWGFLVFLVVLAGLLGYEWVHQNSEAASGGQEIRNILSSTNSGPVNLTVIPEKRIYQGNLLLVNKEHPVHNSGISTDIVTLSQHPELVKGYVLLDNSIKLSRRVAEKFSAMVQAASGQGIQNFVISSGYRDEQKQEQLYEEKGAEYALPPGYSEHNLGLSLDVGSTQMEMSRAPEGQWLQEHAWEYGFILRYPQDKTAITGIQYEPWHFRYVGLPHSVVMRDKNFTLEEYLEYLKEQQSLSASVNGENYQITYVAVSGNTPVPAPAVQNVEFSGNNIDGVIMTVYP